jgi:hypothetical protein
MSDDPLVRHRDRSLADEDRAGASPDWTRPRWTPRPRRDRPPGADLVRRIRASAKPRADGGLPGRIRAVHRRGHRADVPGRGAAAGARRRNHGCPDRRQDRPATGAAIWGKSASSLVNASTWALMLTGKVLDDREGGIVGATARGRQAAGRAGDPHRRVPRDEGDGPQVRAGRNHRQGDGPRARAGGEGLHLQL